MMKLNIPLLEDDTVAFNATLLAIVRQSLTINTSGIHITSIIMVLLFDGNLFTIIYVLLLFTGIQKFIPNIICKAFSSLTENLCH